MSQATWEEASRCPKCETPGEDIAKTPNRQRRGSFVHTMQCPNEACGFRWIIQVNSDGSIPMRREGDKEFPERGEFGDALARRTLEQLAAEDPIVAQELRKLEGQ